MVDHAPVEDEIELLATQHVLQVVHAALDVFDVRAEELLYLSEAEYVVGIDVKGYHARCAKSLERERQTAVERANVDAVIDSSGGSVSFASSTSTRLRPGVIDALARARSLDATGRCSAR